MTVPNTLPAYLLERARRDPSGVAMRFKRRGIYHEISWAEYGHQVERVCSGLLALGLKPGDRVAILGDSCPGWLYGEMATLAAGGVCYGIYPTSSQAQVAMLLAKGAPSIIFVKDQECADKVLAVADGIEALRWIVVIDLQGMFGYDDSRLIALHELMDLPREPVSLEDLVGRVRPQDPALIVFTSGTTAEPRGAVHSHETLIAGARDYRACLVPPTAKSWRTVCHLPLNHIFEQFNTLTLPLLAPVIPHFGEQRAAPTQTLHEVAPDLYASVPRYWQKLAAHILVGIDGSSWLKQAVYNLAMRAGRRALQARWDGTSSLGHRLLWSLARLVAFRPILDKVGLKRVKVGVTAGGPIPLETQTLWQIWGVNLKNLYGQTEGGFIAVQQESFPQPGDVGSAAPSVTVQLAPDGEIIVRGPGAFVGYWRDDEAASKVRQDGWVATGDVASLTPEGHLRIVDRKKDLLITQGGKNISPQIIEDKLRASPYIAEAVVFGEGQRYLVALVEIDEETVAHWAHSKGLTCSGFAALAAASEVCNLIQGVVDAVNRELGRVEQIKAFRILPRALDPEIEGEPVTPTRKVKRRMMYERFRGLVDAMYGDGESERIAEEVGPRG